MLFYVFLLGLMVPIEAMIVPLYYDLRDLGLTDTYWALILPQIAPSVAFGTFWMRAFFRGVPRSLVEAARIDGASTWFTLWRVLLPLARPAVLTMTVLLFMWTWNEFLLALVMVSDENLRTAPLGLAFFQGRNTSDLTLLAAGVGDRRDAGRDRLRLPAAALHPRHAHRGGEGLMAGVRFDAVGKRSARSRPCASCRSRSPTASSWCWSGRRARARRRRCGCSPGWRRSRRARSGSATRVVNKVAPRERDIAMVFQDYALYPQMTVFDNLAFGLRRRKVPRAEIQRRVDEAARVLDIEPLLERKPGQLSGGQAQRVALGRALVREPQVFLMDEPLSNLDAKLRTQTRGEIRRLQQEVGTTTVYVTHDQVEAMTMGDRIAVMNDGVLEQVGTPEELYERPANRFVAGFIGSPAMSLLRAWLGRRVGCSALAATPSSACGPSTRGAGARAWSAR